jgi:hypothetical protein
MQNPFVSAAQKIFPLPKDLIESISSYLSGFLWLFSRNISGEISQITYDCFKERTCYQTIRDECHPLYGIYHIVDLQDLQDPLAPPLKKRVNKQNRDAFYDETCLSRTCGIDGTTPDICTNKRVQIENPTSISPEWLRFGIDGVVGEYKSTYKTYAVERSYKRQQDGALVFSLGALSVNRQIYYFLGSQDYAQILLEEQRQVPWTWALYQDDLLIIIDNEKKNGCATLRMYKIRETHDPKQCRYHCFNDEETLELPSLQKEESWKIICDNHHQLIHLVSQSWLLQFHVLYAPKSTPQSFSFFNKR